MGFFGFLPFLPWLLSTSMLLEAILRGVLVRLFTVVLGNEAMSSEDPGSGLYSKSCSSVSSVPAQTNRDHQQFNSIMYVALICPMVTGFVKPVLLSFVCHLIQMCHMLFYINHTLYMRYHFHWTRLGLALKVT